MEVILGLKQLSNFHKLLTLLDDALQPIMVQKHVDKPPKHSFSCPLAKRVSVGPRNF